MAAASQPLDQGIIQNVKLFYRRAVLDKLLSCADNCHSATEFTSKVNVLDAIRLVHGAWNDVSKATIRKCFVHAGFRIPTDDQGS